MDIKEFIKENKNNVLQSNSLIDTNAVKDVENITGVKIGKQLAEYMTTYGYLIFESIELYGITARQALEESDIL